ncbi:four helix bundle protein [Salinibacter ruber]|uniref:four helix bundle protein n=1 Tax=Salinibacter ruber TaxID=146919 RepID=UPI002169CA4F
MGRAKASAGEVRSQLVIAYDQGYLNEEDFSETSDLADKVSRQLYKLIQHLERSDDPGHIRELPVEYITD